MGTVIRHTVAEPTARTLRSVPTGAPDLVCATVGELVSAALDGELVPGEQRLHDEHLLGCPPCRRYAERLSAVTRRLRIGPVVTPPDLTSQVLDALRRRCSPGGEAPSSTSR